jgi:hypothetical protein
MTGAGRAACSALAVITLLAGCASPVELQDSTLESSAKQLSAADRSGFPTRVIAIDEALDADEAIVRYGGVEAGVTYLVLTRTDARIVWSDGLASDPPTQEKALLGKWVVPFLRFDDRDGALKAFVFGYLLAMHEAGHIEWDEAIVPFLPPGSLGPTNYTWGLLLALIVMLVVAWSASTTR